MADLKKRRVVYMDDDTWNKVETLAFNYGVSRSQALVALVENNDHAYTRAPVQGSVEIDRAPPIMADAIPRIHPVPKPSAKKR